MGTTITRDEIIEWIKAYGSVVSAEKEQLTRLDAALGDADHSANLDRGMQAVLKRLPSVADHDIGAILTAVGMTLVSTVGGASGALYGTLFLKMGSTCAAKQDLTLADWVAALRAGVDGVSARGKANPGDKTMIDALVPAVTALATAEENGTSLPEALHASAKAAEQGARDTANLIARKGRASYLGERSLGHQDPGATSAALLLQAIAQVAG